MEQLMKRVEEWSQLFESKAQRGMCKSTTTRGTVTPVAYTLSPHTPKRQVKNIKIAAKKDLRPIDFAVEKTVFTMPIYGIIE